MLAQVASQGFAFVAGIFIVRSLNPGDYAIYAICVSVAASLLVLSDSGVTSVLIARGSAVIANGGKLDRLVASAWRFRVPLLSLVAGLGSALLCVLLLLNGVGALATSFYTALVIVTVGPMLGRSINQNLLRLARRPIAIQAVAASAAALRLILVLTAVFLGLFGIAVGLVIGIVCILLESWILSQLVAIDRRKNLSDSADRAYFRQAMRDTLPMNLLTVAQSQMLFLMLTLFGTVETIAVIAAVSRFAIVFAIVNGFVIDFLAAPVAAIADGRSLALSFARVLGGYGLVCLLLVTASYVFSGELLLLLGEEYEGERHALVIVCLGTALINLGNSWRTLNHARGWTAGSWLYVPCVGVWLMVGWKGLDLNDSVEASVFMALQCLAPLVTQVWCSIQGSIKFARGNA